ncbi:DMT family transporter [Treponema vincentii]|uniref:DMT family transporter n=1 Tax=Treponema vincentii TaxID=69710 RepID=UPI0020A489CF|nr:DMT family transporter [Treponema vincentii]UTC47600.1 DMT family transporter [Treponema vincentii]
MNKELLGVVGLLSATILWGAGFLAVDLALTAFTPMQIMAVRFFLASIIMFFAARRNLHTVLRQEIIAGLIMGLCLFLAFTLQTIGLKFSTLSNNAFLTATNVVFVPFLVWGAYKKRPTLSEFAGMILAIAGAGFLTLANDFSIGIGDTLSLAGAFFFACQVFFTGKYAPHYRIDILSFVQMATAFVLSCAALPFTGGMSGIVWGKNALLSILYLGIVSTAITYFLQTASQQYVKQVQAVIILSLEAVFATIFSVLLIHERLSFRVLCGAVLILSAVLISELKLKKTKIYDTVK